MQKNEEKGKENLCTKRTWRLFAVAFLLAGAVGFAVFATTPPPPPPPVMQQAKAVITSSGGEKARFDIDIAVTSAQKSKGLQHVPHLAKGKGMLFVYQEPRFITMWMKDTLIPLDMVFLKDGRILHVHPNAVPMSEEVISAPQPATHVLEIGGGEAKRLGLAPGDVFAYHLTDTNDKKNVPGESN